MEVATDPDLGFSDANEYSAASSTVVSVRTVRAQDLKISRRLSGLAILSAYEAQEAPLADPEALARFDALIDKFPRPPTHLEPVSAHAQTQQAQRQANGANAGGWGIKGLAERFGLFSKA